MLSFKAILAALLPVLAFSNPVVEKRQSLARVVSSCTKPNNVALTFVRFKFLLLCLLFASLNNVFDFFDFSPSRTMGLGCICNYPLLIFYSLTPLIHLPVTMLARPLSLQTRLAHSSSVRRHTTLSLPFISEMLITCVNAELFKCRWQ